MVCEPWGERMLDRGAGGHEVEGREGWRGYGLQGGSNGREGMQEAEAVADVPVWMLRVSIVRSLWYAIEIRRTEGGHEMDQLR